MTRSASPYVFSLIALALAQPACGGKAFDNGDGPNGGNTNAGNASGGTSSGGSSNHAGSASGGKAHGGNSSGGKSSGGSATGGMGADGGSAGAPQCSGYDDELPSNVPVRLVNETSQPIYLGPDMPGCGIGSLFTVADATGAQLSPPGFCTTTCQHLIRGEIIGCPAIACAVGSAITLQPGESAQQLWNGLFMAEVTLPPACRPAPDVAGCERIMTAKPGTYVFSAQAGTKQDCSQFGGGPCQQCMPDSNGGCTTFGALVVGPMISAELKIELDGSYGLGGPGGGGMVRPIEIVFKN